MSPAAQLQRVPDAETIRKVTRQIVTQPEFDESWPWLEKIVAVLNAIKEWLDSLEAWAVANPQSARLLAILVVIVLVALLIHLLYLAFGDLLPWKRGAKAAPARASSWEILEGAAKDWRAGAELALGLLKEGDLRRAVWIAHRVLLGLLDERGALRFAGWKTNSQYLSECAASHPWYDTFADLTEVYEHTVYGQQSAPAAAVELLVKRIDAMTKESAQENVDDLR
ncbi:MAG: DUF4129 domain-containing protein [Candidatus Binatia bacterium]